MPVGLPAVAACQSPTGPRSTVCCKTLSSRPSDRALHAPGTGWHQRQSQCWRGRVICAPVTVSITAHPPARPRTPRPRRRRQWSSGEWRVGRTCLATCLADSPNWRRIGDTPVTGGIRDAAVRARGPVVASATRGDGPCPRILRPRSTAGQSMRSGQEFTATASAHHGSTCPGYGMRRAARRPESPTMSVIMLSPGTLPERGRTSRVLPDDPWARRPGWLRARLPADQRKRRQAQTSRHNA
jgi:hypothetical protein